MPLFCRYADAVELLLKAGAKPNLMDMEGKNALDYAESAEFEDVVAMLAACDNGPSMCSTFRDGTEPSLTARAGLSTLGGATAAAVVPSPRMAGAMTNRMTPRVPNAGDVSSRLTPRMPHNSGDGGRGGSDSFRGMPSGRPAYRTSGGGKQVEISPEQMSLLEQEKVLNPTPSHNSLLPSYWPSHAARVFKNAIAVEVYVTYLLISTSTPTALVNRCFISQKSWFICLSCSSKTRL